MLIVAPKFENIGFGAKTFQWHQIVRMRTSRRLGNMVAVMANEQQQFESLVSQLMSPDNNIRNQAEVRRYFFFVVVPLYFFKDERNNVVGCCRQSPSRTTLAGWTRKPCAICASKIVHVISDVLQLIPIIWCIFACLCFAGIIFLRNSLNVTFTHVFLLLFLNHVFVTWVNANLRKIKFYAINFVFTADLGLH